MCLFQAHALFVAHQPSQEIGGVCTASEELRVGAAIRYAGDGVLRLGHHFRHKLRVGTAVRPEKLDVEITGERQIEHDLDGMFVLLFGDVADGSADVGL